MVLVNIPLGRLSGELVCQEGSDHPKKPHNNFAQHKLILTYGNIMEYTLWWTNKKQLKMAQSK